MTAGSGTRDVLVIRTLGYEWGMDREHVEDVLPHRPAVRAPGSAPFVEGIVRYRDSVIPVVDLALRFRVPAGARPPGRDTAPAAARRTLVVRLAGGLAGLTVDEVAGSRRADEAHVLPLPRLAWSPIVAGCLAEPGADLLVILDPRRILETDASLDLPLPPGWVDADAAGVADQPATPDTPPGGVSSAPPTPGGAAVRVESALPTSRRAADGAATAPGAGGGPRLATAPAGPAPAPSAPAARLLAPPAPLAPVPAPRLPAARAAPPAPATPVTPGDHATVPTERPPAAARRLSGAVPAPAAPAAPAAPGGTTRLTPSSPPGSPPAPGSLSGAPVARPAPAPPPAAPPAATATSITEATRPGAPASTPGAGATAGRPEVAPSSAPRRPATPDRDEPRRADGPRPPRAAPSTPEGGSAPAPRPARDARGEGTGAPLASVPGDAPASPSGPTWAPPPAPPAVPYGQGLATGGPASAARRPEQSPEPARDDQRPPRARAIPPLPPLGRAPITVTASHPPADADVPGRSAARALAAAALVVLVVGAAWLLTEWRREGRRALTAPVSEGPGNAAPVAAAAAGAPAARRTAVPPERLVLNIEETVPGGRAAAPRGFGAGAETPEIVDYTVVRGDTLWAIARRFTRNPFHYREIASENDVRDPNLIVPGQQLTLRIHRLAAAPDPTPR